MVNKDILKTELLRKAFHLTGLVVPFLYYFFVPRDPAMIYLTIALLVAGVLEALRLSGRMEFPGHLRRDPSENKRLYGYFLGILSMLLAIFLFDKAIAIASILFMLIGDSASGLAGAAIIRRGVRPLADTKPPSVMAVMLSACILSGLLLYPVLSLPVVIAGALGATIAEAFPWRILGRKINDNLSIPLVSGAIMTLAAIILS